LRALLALVVLTVILSAGLAGVAIFPHASSADPCDSYGDCVSASIAYIRANPDNTLYLGDQFSITIQATPGSGGTGCGSNCSESWSSALSGVTWSYNTSALRMTGGGTSAQFASIANDTESQTVTAAASFLVTITTCVTTISSNTTSTAASTATAASTTTSTTATPTTTCTASNVLSQLTVSEQVSLRAFVLAFKTLMENVTAPNSLITGGKELLRNSDGSFYHDDEFMINYTYSFLFMQQRPDIKVIVEPQFDPSFVKLTAYQNSSSTGYFLFTVANSTGVSKVTVSAEAFNYQGALLGSKTQNQPFAVVNYAPYFKYFTYMDYNSQNSSTYERPFVTLVRYDGNDPGYSYAGDANTAPITAVNDTGERALIDDFTFSTQGWNTTVRLVSASIGQDMQFTGYPVSVSYDHLNETYPLITWGDRVQKYYFQGNLTDFERYAPDGMTYYNLTEYAWSSDFAGAPRLSLFNTTYLYEPVYYSGYLMFNFYDASGKPDLSSNVTIVSYNPSPLNVYLLDCVKAKFGDDPAVLDAFGKDLYPSNYTITLKQLQPNVNGTIVYLLNQTNLAMMGNDAFPSFNVTVHSEVGGTAYQFTSQTPYLTGESTLTCAASSCTGVSYQVPGSWGLFLMNATALSSLPFPNATAYYVTPTLENLALPLNSTLSGAPVWYANWYGNTTEGPVIDANIPVSVEPGDLTNLYQLIYGQNTTVDVNTAGGGIGLLPGSQLGDEYQLALAINPASGGVTQIWAVDSEGVVLTNASLPTVGGIASFSPPAFFGVYVMTIPVADNGTMTVTLLNAWGAKTTIEGIPVTAHAIPPPPGLWDFFCLVTVILLGIGALASLLKWREARKEGGYGNSQMARSLGSILKGYQISRFGWRLTRGQSFIARLPREVEQLTGLARACRSGRCSTAALP